MEAQECSSHRFRLPQLELEFQAREASKEYHDEIWKQRKAHRDEFPADDINIWHAARYMNLGSHSTFEDTTTNER
jgi:hypothetical protein